MGSMPILDVTITDTPTTPDYNYHVTFIAGTREIFSVTDTQGRSIPEDSLIEVEMLFSNLSTYPEYDPHQHNNLYIYITRLSK